MFCSFECSLFVIDLFAKEWEIPNKGDDSFTFSSDNPTHEIDFIMTGKGANIVLENIDAIEEPVASDHRPVVADIKFRESK